MLGILGMLEPRAASEIADQSDYSLGIVILKCFCALHTNGALGISCSVDGCSKHLTRIEP